jgi:hypothetical protein
MSFSRLSHAFLERGSYGEQAMLALFMITADVEFSRVTLLRAIQSNQS